MFSASVGGDLDHFLNRIDGMKPHANMVLEIGRQVEADDVGLDGDLAMAAIDQDRQADARRTSQVADGIEGGPDGPTREQDVIYQHHLGPVDVEWDLGAAQHGPSRAVLEIVAVERDVDRADVDILPEQPLQLLSEPLREGNAARSNPHEAKRRACPTGVGELASHGANQTVDFMVIAEPLLARIHLDHPHS
jgi:hypothetical protein